MIYYKSQTFSRCIEWAFLRRTEVTKSSWVLMSYNTYRRHMLLSKNLNDQQMWFSITLYKAIYFSASNSFRLLNKRNTKKIHDHKKDAIHRPKMSFFDSMSKKLGLVGACLVLLFHQKWKKIELNHNTEGWRKDSLIYRVLAHLNWVIEELDCTDLQVLSLLIKIVSESKNSEIP